MASDLIELSRIYALFLATAVAEILGCYLPFLWLRRAAPVWVLVPSALSLAAFAWLLTRQPSSAGRTYAEYGGVYVATALLWMWLVEGQKPDQRDVVGAAVCVLGTAIIAFGRRG